MNRDDQQAIEGLFGRLAEAERSAPARDPEAETFIAKAITAQPGAPYYMAQTIVAQQAALEHSQARVKALEAEARERPAGGGGFLAGLFGGGAQRPAPRGQASGPASTALRQNHHGGGGFLAGAAQTAVGVAGGVLLGNAIAGMFAGDPAMAEEAPAEEDMGFSEEDFEM